MNASVGTCLHIVKNQRCLVIVFVSRVKPASDLARETSTATQSTILQRGGPVGAAPHGWPPEIPSVWLVKHKPRICQYLNAYELWFQCEAIH